MENKIIYARQILPELQESDIWDDEYFNDIIVKGNKDYSEHNADLLYTVSNIAEDIYNFAESKDISEFSSESDYKKVAEWLSDYYTTETHKSWTAGEVKRFILTVAKAEQCEITGRYKIGSYREDFTAALLSVYTGTMWEWATINGCCQSEWNIIYYPKEKYTDEDIEMFETGYFNTGTEWIIHDGDYIPEAPDDICGYSMYCYTNNPIKEIAESEGVSADDVVLYKCEMRYMPVYTRV